jgi:D-beta-D-heptose 7-phosphate kinase/D-beta-D-heptose 1-phosphate adenosyltransferase
MANAAGCKVIVDPKRNCKHYKGAWLIKPNDIESRNLGFESWDGNTLLTTHTTNVLIIDDKSYFSDVEEGEIVDVTGAGDCFLAAFVYGLVKGYDYQRCVDVATKGATKSVQYAGTYVLKAEDVESKVIFTNGCFDILHRGHIDYLERSKKLGDKLIVGLNSDASIKRLKGESRPINNEEDRKTLLGSLKYVDEVIIFDEDTPYELIKKIKPDIITKGGDYTPETIVGNDLAEVIVLPYVKDYSTTNIVSKLND